MSLSVHSRSCLVQRLTSAKSMLSHTVNLGGLSGSYRVVLGFQCHIRRIAPALTGVVSLPAIEMVSSSEVAFSANTPCEPSTSFEGSHRFSEPSLRTVRERCGGSSSPPVFPLVDVLCWSPAMVCCGSEGALTGSMKQTLVGRRDESVYRPFDHPPIAEYNTIPQRSHSSRPNAPT